MLSIFFAFHIFLKVKSASFKEYISILTSTISSIL